MIDVGAISRVIVQTAVNTNRVKDGIRNRNVCLIYFKKFGKKPLMWSEKKERELNNSDTCSAKQELHWK